MRLGKRCKWEDIEIGEIFAIDDCTIIVYKQNKNKAILVADDFSCYEGTLPMKRIPIFSSDKIHKLNKRIQEYWLGRN